jgi:hypothetical protein
MSRPPEAPSIALIPASPLVGITPGLSCEARVALPSRASSARTPCPTARRSCTCGPDDFPKDCFSHPLQPFEVRTHLRCEMRQDIPSVPISHSKNRRSPWIQGSLARQKRVHTSRDVGIEHYEIDPINIAPTAPRRESGSHVVRPQLLDGQLFHLLRGALATRP